MGKATGAGRRFAVARCELVARGRLADGLGVSAQQLGVLGPAKKRARDASRGIRRASRWCLVFARRSVVTLRETPRSRQQSESGGVMRIARIVSHLRARRGEPDRPTEGVWERGRYSEEPLPPGISVVGILGFCEFFLSRAWRKTIARVENRRRDAQKRSLSLFCTRMAHSTEFSTVARLSEWLSRLSQIRSRGSH